MQLNTIKLYSTSCNFHDQLSASIDKLNKELSDDCFDCELAIVPEYSRFQQMLRYYPAMSVWIPAITVYWQKRKIMMFELQKEIQTSDLRALNNKIVISGIVRKFRQFPVVPRGGHEKIQVLLDTEENLSIEIIKLVKAYIVRASTSAPSLLSGPQLCTSETILSRPHEIQECK